MTSTASALHVHEGDTGLDLLRQWQDRGSSLGGFFSLIGARVEAYADGEVVVRCEIDEGHANFIGLVHGGLTAALIDMAGGAMMSRLTPGQIVLTTDLAVRYLNGASQDCTALEAKGVVTYQDARKAVVDVVVTTDDGLDVARGVVGLAIRPHPV
ncbi:MULTISPECIES: PaaI family thioesterase [unclassified Brevundimonas]|uniref:PaaI family thioesterase n=1 Tax=unclassified Brevundimonas TaxID=2622653 RepID=UPI002002F433|nr:MULTISPECIES: PaaI family thioesterase [unclassified Brevundimonas]MCK6103602.1 PaaI family thioesterase [Brevundimonas sp. EYE_349]